MIEPIKFEALTAADARAFNAAIPFSTAANPPARPFAFAGSEEDRSRALGCLAAAVLYEAGHDSTGQRAVAQVVLNRVRHAAFPRTVCGVVFQGSERRTGCQFTFTCDGALAHAYPEPFWERARRVADAALSGSVYRPVGQATHYHTDWVVPYWSSSLDKIVAIHTHLFFRWAGWWGTPPAFRFRATGSEPRVADLASRFPEHGAFDAKGLDAARIMGKGLPPATLAGASVRSNPDKPDAFFVLLSPAEATRFAEIAASTCGVRPRCKILGWTDPASLPHDVSVKLTPEQLATVSFSYLRDRSINYEKALWNCAQFKWPVSQCMWSKSPPPGARAASSSKPGPSTAPIAPLEGLRFKEEKRVPGAA